MQCSRCRAALPAGSLFCNACGTPVAAGGSAQPPQSGPQPAQAYQPPVQPYQPHVTQQPGTMQPYAGQPNGHYAPPADAPPATGKKPVMLLAVLLTLIAGGVVAGGVMMWKKSQPSVVSAGAPPQASGPAVTQTASAELPQSPSVVAGQLPPPKAGAPVTAATPQPSDDVPSILMAPGSQTPQGGSVTTVQTPSIPQAPGIVQAPGQPVKPAAPVTGAPRQPTPQAPPQAAPPPPNNADFDRYIHWLRYVEQQRATLRAQGETESFRMIEQFYGVMLGFADPDSNDVQLQAQLDQNLRNTLQRTLVAINQFRTNITRTKPPVPADCGALDQHYMRAVSLEAEQTVTLMQALARKDIGAVRSAGSGVGKIDMSLGMANKQLEKVYEGRGLNQLFTIETGGNSSLLGGLVGLGAR